MTDPDYVKYRPGADAAPLRTLALSTQAFRPSLRLHHADGGNLELLCDRCNALIVSAVVPPPPPLNGPLVSHCPICHGEPANSRAADGWDREHQTFHDRHGCPQCDREAGYPR